MRGLRAWFVRLAALFHKERHDREMTAELESHLQMQIEDNMRSGMSAGEARRQALMKLGGLESAKESYRERRSLPFFETLGQDARFGMRMLRRTPTFTIVALFTLALAIGANTAIFSVLDAVLLRPLPYPDPDRLVVLYMRFTGIGIPNDQNAVSAPEFRDLQQLSNSFSGIAAINGNNFTMTVAGTPVQLAGVNVSPSFFSILGVQPQLGRSFLPEEAQPGAAPVAVLSYGLWQRAFGGDPSALGRSIIVNTLPTKIVGVMPRGFDYPNSEIWTPLAFAPADLAPDQRGNHGLAVIARVKPELTMAQARADMAAVSEMIIRQNPKYPYKKFNFAVLTNSLMDDTVSQDIRKSLWVLMAAVGCVLLIACANVASLMLSRASSRERETAVRLALGAGFWRLVRQFLTESVVLAFAGGALGLAAVPFMLRGLVALSADALPRTVDTSINLPMLLFTAAVSVGTGIVFGVWPAIRTVRGVGYNTLKEGGRSSTMGWQGHRSLRLLVAGEAAISIVLLVGAGLLIRSFQQVLHVHPGFRPNGVLTMQVSLPQEKYPKFEQQRVFFREALARIRALPGVAAAGAIGGLPLTGNGGSGTTYIDTQAVPEDKKIPEVDYRATTPGYFQAMGIDLLEGRYFTEGDNENSAMVAIVDETLAHTFFPGESAVGKRAKLRGRESMLPWMTIVGVVRHVRYRTLEAPSRTELYWVHSQSQFPPGAMDVAIRCSGNPQSIALAAQQALQSIDPDQPASHIRTMEQWMADSLARRRLALTLLALFAGVALVMAAAGIYGTTSFSVTERYQEMGVRIALGASRVKILALVIGQGMTLILAGLTVGAVGAFLFTRWIRSMLFNIRPVDPLALLGGLLLLVAVALLACYLPARRATKVDPIVVLRYE